MLVNYARIWALLLCVSDSAMLEFGRITTCVTELCSNPGMNHLLFHNIPCGGLAVSFARLRHQVVRYYFHTNHFRPFMITASCLCVLAILPYTRCPASHLPMGLDCLRQTLRALPGKYSSDIQ